MMEFYQISMQEFREIVSVKWENNVIVGVKLKTMSIGKPQEVYKTLKELHDEFIQNFTDTKVKKRELTTNPVLTLPYLNEEDGGQVSKFVYIAKIGSQYEIRDVKDEIIPKTLLEMENI